MFNFRYSLFILLLFSNILFAGGKKEKKEEKDTGLYRYVKPTGFNYNFRISGIYEKKNVILSWNENPSPKIKKYAIYRSFKPIKALTKELKPIKVSENDNYYIDTIDTLDNYIYYALVVDDEIIAVLPIRLSDVKQKNEPKPKKSKPKKKAKKKKDIKKNGILIVSADGFKLINTKKIYITDTKKIISNSTYENILNLYNVPKEVLLNTFDDTLKTFDKTYKNDIEEKELVILNDKNLKEEEKLLKDKKYYETIEESFKFLKNNKDKLENENAYFYIGQAYYFLKEYDVAYSYFSVLKTKQAKDFLDNLKYKKI